MAASPSTTKKARLIDKRRKIQRIKVVSALIILILAYAGAGFALAHRNLSITKFSMIGNAAVSNEMLTVTIQKGLSITRGLLLYGGTLFTYDKDSIVREILYEHPQLKTAALKATKIDTLELTVTEREAVAYWCDAAADCYNVDKDGFVFDTLEEKKEGVIVYEKGLSQGNPLRKNLLVNDFMRVHSFIQDIRTKRGIDVTTVVLLENNEAEIMSTEHPRLKVKLDDSLERTLSYIQITLESQEYKDFISEEESIQRYIDLRFGNRVYYK